MSKTRSKWYASCFAWYSCKRVQPVLTASTTDAKTIDFFKKAFSPKPPLTKAKPVKKRSKNHEELVKFLMAQGQTLEAGHAVGVDEPALVQIVGVVYGLHCCPACVLTLRCLTAEKDNDDKFLSVLAVECSPCKLTLTADHLQHPVCELKLSPDEYTQLMQRFGGDDSGGEAQRQGEAETEIQHETQSAETDAKESEMETDAEPEPKAEKKSKAKGSGRKRKAEEAPEPKAKKAKAKTVRAAKSKRKNADEVCLCRF